MCVCVCVLKYVVSCERDDMRPQTVKCDVVY